MHKQVTDRDFSVFEGLENLVKFIDEKYPKIHDAAVCRFIDDSFDTIIHRLAYDKDYEKKIVKVKKICKKYWKEGTRNPYLSRMKRLQLRILLFNVKLYRGIYLVRNNSK